MRHSAFFIFIIFTTALHAQQEFQGRVVDAETGKPLPYASIYLSKDKGTITNDEGNFCIEAKASDVVSVSFIGYNTLKIKAGELKQDIRMMPMSHSLKEVTVIPTEVILQKVLKQLVKDYKKHSHKKSNFFYRLNLDFEERQELVEAFFTARPAVNLRNIMFLTGIRALNRKYAQSESNIIYSNLQHLADVGPLTFDVKYWQRVKKPFHVERSAIDYSIISSIRSSNYDISAQVLYGENGQKIYKINMASKPECNYSILEGALYVDASNYALQSFDGKLRNFTLEVGRSLRNEESAVESKVRIIYTQRRGFTEVESIVSSIKAGTLTCHSVAFNMEESELPFDKGTNVTDNMLEAIDNAGYNSTLWNKAIVLRTEKEENLIKKTVISNDDVRQWNFVVKDDSFNMEIFRPFVERLAAFGKTIPQEKLYVHMDNTCYFQGDTIWFSAFTRNTATDAPSQVSGVLYAELLNNDGYLVERKMIEMKEGRGNGFFALNNPVQYSGFYELRAYTRWQLNWGVHEHKHSKAASEWFLSKELEQEYYRDYDKLYSRVFPVYDRPRTPGDYTRDMTMRVMRRTFKNDPDAPRPILTLFPEGGNLVAGVPNRVAFEAVWSDGLQMEGSLAFESSPADSATSVSTRNRGRGVFTVTPEAGKAKEVVFTSADGQQVKAQLPKPEEQGVAITVRRDSAGSWRIAAHRTGRLSADSLALTIMHEGRLTHFRRFAEVEGEGCIIPEAELQTGVQQATVFDTQGHVWADRLFFVTKAEDIKPTLTVKGLKDEYQPHEKIRLEVEGAAADAQVSIAVRDAYQADGLFDNGTILTEMLLASEIRGFVPDAGWFFEKDDEEHREALDLLMMTQGWRRFSWRDMAVKGEWELTQPDERTPIIEGKVSKSYGGLREEERLNLVNEYAAEAALLQMDYLALGEEERRKQKEAYEEKQAQLRRQTEENLTLKSEIYEPTQMEKEVRVHGELFREDLITVTAAEIETKQARFRMQLPRYYEKSILFLDAADTTKWGKRQTYNWIRMKTDMPSEFLVRVHMPYPRFVKPYGYYQEHLTHKTRTPAELLANTTHNMSEIVVKGRKGTLRRFDQSQPAIIIDAYEAWNLIDDAGIQVKNHIYSTAANLTRTLFGDYGLIYPYSSKEETREKEKKYDFSIESFLNKEEPDRIYEVYGLGATRRALPQYIDIPVDSLYSPKYLRTLGKGIQMPPNELDDFKTSKIDKYVIYTDYCPRLEGSQRYSGDNLPETRVAVYPYYDGRERLVYANRRYILPGFPLQTEFYSPDYSRQTPPEPNDYRRTLYWNPNVKLDHEGRANITLWNCSRATRPQVEAAGQSTDGTLLWNKTENR